MNHSHVLYDSDPHFNIDPISRNIVNASSKKVRLIQYDHNSERFTFEIPRHIEGHDMAMCNLVEIHYAVQEANTKIIRGGVYTVDDLQVYSENDDVVVCSWLIPHNVTQYVGQLQFLIRFACVNNDTGRLDYVWNTGIHTGITISSGIYNNESQSDNQAPPFNFITMVSGEILKFSVVDQLSYDTLKDSGSLLPNCMYIVTDDPSVEEIDVRDLSDKIDEVSNELDTVSDKVDGLIGELNSGDFTVTDSEHANNADYANSAGHANTANTANIATYADENESKGTIENRLQKMFDMVFSVVDHEFEMTVDYTCPGGTRDEQMAGSMMTPDISSAKPYGANEDWKIIGATVNTGSGKVSYNNDSIWFMTGNGIGTSGKVTLRYQHKQAQWL